MKPQPPPPPPSHSRPPRLPSPLPMPTHPTASGPEQFSSFASSHLRSLRSSRPSSSGSSSSRAGPSRTGPYLGVGEDGPSSASGSSSRKRKQHTAKEEEDHDDDVELLSSSKRLSSKAKGKGKERALPSPAPSSSSSRRRVIAAPLPGEESEEEKDGSEKEKLSDYNCPVCLCPPVQATLTPCGHLMCHLCLTTSLATTAIRTFVQPPLWRPFPPTVNPSLLNSQHGRPPRYAPSTLNIEGICPVCREVLPGGLTGKGKRTGAGVGPRGGRGGGRGGGFGMGGRWKEAEGKGEGVRRLEMRVVDC